MVTDAKKLAELEKMVADVDRGGRKVEGIAKHVLAIGALLWTFFQLWIASPLPFEFNFGIFNDTEARSIHLGFAMFLGLLAYPLGKSHSHKMPAYDWILAIVAGFCGAYLYLFYQELSTRPGIPTILDVIAGTLGVLLLLEITRRALGWPMTILGMVMLAYVFLGPYLPDVLSHKGASVNRLVSHMWLETEGVFGVALGVSTSYIFIFVLLGSLLDKCGAGNYLMQVSFAMLGHLRGGPAKVAVVSSAVNGIVSASSVANVVTGGIFTIPLMKKAGYGGIRAGAIETSSSVNGQIMPPVMGAAAFLMIEYVGVPYTEIIKNAFLPATISYISLFYIVHLEALKLGIQPMMAANTNRTFNQKLIGYLLGITGTLAVMGAFYYIGTGVQALAGASAIWILVGLLVALYLGLIFIASKYEDLPTDINITSPVKPETWPTVRAGLFYLIPIAILVWCLSIEMLSAGLSAFYSVLSLVFLMMTQRPLMSLFRREDSSGAFKRGFIETVQGLEEGARNMIGIAIACGTAGLIVGAITLTGLGLRMTAFVELVSMGNVLIMLFFTAFVCLILGLGMPTTANYILMATLMAPVVVELGAQNDLIIPLIAVHFFVFYFGIMADITPPVGLATFAAAAISGEDPIKTGIQGVVYAMRTAILPFIFVFNPMLLLIGVDSTVNLVVVIFGAIVASMIFAASTMLFFRIRSTFLESLLLMIAAFMMFRPDWYMNRMYPEYETKPLSEIYKVAAEVPNNGRFVARIQGMTLEGNDLSKLVSVNLQDLEDTKGKTPDQIGKERLRRTGLTLMPLGDTVQVGQVKFGSQAAKARWENQWDVVELMVPNHNKPNVAIMFIPAFILIGLVWWLQGRRGRREGTLYPQLRSTQTMKA